MTIYDDSLEPRPTESGLRPIPAPCLRGTFMSMDIQSSLKVTVTR